NKDIDLEPGELGRDLVVAFTKSLRPAIFDRDGVALGPTKLAQPLHEDGEPGRLDQTWARGEKPDGRQPARSLRARRERPCCRRAAEQRDELAPFQVIELHSSPCTSGSAASAEFVLHGLLRARDGDIRSHVGAHLSIPKKWSKVCADGGVQ